MGLTLVLLSTFWQTIEKRKIDHSLRTHYQKVGPYKSAADIVGYINDFKDKYYCHRYVIFLIIQFVVVCILFATICNVMDVSVNGMSFDVITWLLKEHEDRRDFLSAKFPEIVLCVLDVFSSVGEAQNSDTILCHLGINIMYQSMHIFGLWLHLALVFLVIFDTMWHIYLFATRKHSPLGSKGFPISKQLFCLFIQKNVCDRTWKYVLEMLEMDDDSSAGGNNTATERPDNVQLRNAGSCNAEPHIAIPIDGKNQFNPLHPVLANSFPSAIKNI